ncbi:MAG: helix-turn-helix transcriptional regulator [Eubacterium sp.]|nr:helix-turn-helix transcriptional regulator [Eubacterium sp.]
MNNNEPISVGGRIKKLREEKGESQEKLGEAVGLSQNSISKLEKGETNLTLENLCNMAEHFNVSHDYICTGKNSDSILMLLEKYISLDYSELSEGEEIHLKYPVIRIRKYFFDYLMRKATAQKDKYLPNDVKEMWIEKETKSFYEQDKNDSLTESTSIVPIPPQLIYPDDSKSGWKQSDLLRELNKLLMNNTDNEQGE